MADVGVEQYGDAQAGDDRRHGLSLVEVRGRKALETRGHMLNDDAALKLLFLATRHATTRLNAAPDWTTAGMQFAIFFEGRSNI